MINLTIDKYRIVPAQLTGIGWVAVQEWDAVSGKYMHIATYRSEGNAEAFILAKEAVE